MSRWRPEPLVLGLDARSLVGEGSVRHAPDEGWTPEALATAMAAIVGESRKPVVLMVAPDACRHFIHRAPAGIRSVNELNDLARMKAAQLFGGEASDWTVSADWQLGTPYACAVLPRRWIEELVAVLGNGRLRIESVVLASVERLYRQVADSTWRAWMTSGTLVVANVSGHACNALRCVRLAADLDAGALATAIRREVLQESLRCGVPVSRFGIASVKGAAASGAGTSTEGPTMFNIDARTWLPGPVRDDSEANWARRLVLTAS